MQKKILITSIVLSLFMKAESSVFPVNEFFGLTNFTAEQRYTIEHLLCSCEPDFYKVCDCDENCMKSKSCCIDARWDNNTHVSLDGYLGYFLNEAAKYPVLSCEPIISHLPETHTAEAVFMISSCPENADPGDISKCMDSRSDKYSMPVYDGSGYLYKNKHCAVCNKVTAFQLANVTAECEYKVSNETTSILTQYSDCHFSLVDKETSSVQSCNGNAFDSCTVQNDHDCQLCKSYVGGIQYNDTCFRNIHCFRYQYGGASATKLFSLPANVCENSDFDEWYGITFPTYSMMVSFTSNDQLTESTQDKSCASDELYDKSTDTCISDFACGHGYALNGDMCEKLPTIFETLNTADFEKSSTKETLIEGCLSSIEYLVFSKTNISNATANYEIRDRGITVYENESMIIKKSFITNHTEQFDYKVFRTSSSSVFPTEFYGMDFERNFMGSKLCASPVIHSSESFTISKNCFVFFNTSVLYKDEYVIVSYRDKISNRTVLITCDKFHLNSICPLRRLNDYNKSTNNNIVTRNNIYSAEQYTPLKSGVGVCIIASDNVYRWVKVVSSVEGYLTMIGCSLSIIGYIWVILTYSCIPELRTVPGKNIVCLCVTLMLSDILMLSIIGGKDNKKACKAIAMFLHFVALSVQCWSGIVAFDIWSTFQGKSLKRNMRSNKRFLCYCFFGWVCPLGVTLLCIVLNETNTVIIGYGDQGVCWISNVKSLIVTYILPVVVFTVFTTTSLTYTLCRIRQQSKKSKKLLRKSGGENVSLARMALKLVLLLGVIEICGLLQTTDTSKGSLAFNFVFRLCYSIMRSFRGVFIWLLYVVTDRVFTVYRNIREKRSYRSSTRFTSESKSRKSAQVSSIDHNSSV